MNRKTSWKLIVLLNVAAEVASPSIAKASVLSGGCAYFHCPSIETTSAPVIPAIKAVQQKIANPCKEVEGLEAYRGVLASLDVGRIGELDGYNLEGMKQNYRGLIQYAHDNNNFIAKNFQVELITFVPQKSATSPIITLTIPYMTLNKLTFNLDQGSFPLASPDGQTDTMPDVFNGTIVFSKESNTLDGAFKLSRPVVIDGSNKKKMFSYTGSVQYKRSNSHQKPLDITISLDIEKELHVCNPDADSEAK